MTNKTPPTAHPVDSSVAAAVREGLSTHPKRLPPWLFYDAAGSRLFEQITELPEYYLTRTERSILTAHAGEMIAQAAEGQRLRLVELGAGSADKTRLLLSAAVAQQGTVLYEPLDVSATALEDAKERIEQEIPGVRVAPLVLDYTQGLDGLEPDAAGERRLLLYIGSSIGNFEPRAAERLLQRLRAGLEPGDCLLLGVDLSKDEATLLAAYNDAAGVTAAFNRNVLVRLNRELDANFDPEAFAHRAIWNAAESRIEMHLESRIAQRVHLAALNLEVDFTAGETIHTENSYKYAPGAPQVLLAEAGFAPVGSWTDAQGWFTVCLGRIQ
ncbi:MAG: L-histidine N(alpha)-methyltransferase [Terracidiphilus sp.]|nr:L-histidine N(alpha)-methyltransferase [Terracidiphilus sp.]MDR3776005.1 L-histidine N(alpha)-methyltransferase [Terracidiphilus sp.]